MRVLVVAEIGSVHTHGFVRHLARSGHTVTLIGSTRSGSQFPDCPENVEVIGVGSRTRIGLVRLIPLIRYLTKRRDIEVIHAHYASSYGLIATLSLVRPLVVSVWGTDIMEFPDRSWLHRLLVAIVLKRASAVLATSSALARAAEELGAKDVCETPFGVDVERFAPALGATNQNRFVVGTVRSLEYTYGIDVLIDAFNLFCEHTGVVDSELLIVGDGSLRDSLQHRAKQSQAAEKIHFYGRVPHDDVPVLIRSMDVFAILSRRESYGVAALEASSCGVPVVASRTGGLPEIVRDGVNGILVAPEDPEEAALAIERLFRDKVLRARLAAQGRQRVLDSFSWDVAMETTSRAYAEVRASCDH